MKLRIKFFCHSIVSDWNHGNAHFLRGVLTDLLSRGHDVESLEPAGAWSRQNLEGEFGTAPVEEFGRRYPQIRWRTYQPHESTADLVGDADLVIVHEWNTPELVKSVGELRKTNRNLRVLFHDTHHRVITAPEEMRLNDLALYDGILVYGQTLKDAYRKLGWTNNVHVWHEAADTRVFRPLPSHGEKNGLVWIGNWGDDERTKELHEFMIDPVAELRLRATAYGVRYPADAVEQLQRAGIDYKGWAANYKAPEIFADYQVTVHVPRRPYLSVLAGIPTIRPFEAMACGIPLVCALWQDTEHLFREGQDYLLARSGREMKALLNEVTSDGGLAAKLAASGLETITKRHSCSHRVDELLTIYEGISPQREATTQKHEAGVWN